MLTGAFEKLVRRRSVRATLSTTAVNLLVLCLNLSTGLLTARLLGPEGRGELAAMVLWPQFLASLLTLGLPQATTFNLVRHPSDQGGIVAMALLLSMVLGAVTIVLGVLVIPVWTTTYDAQVISFAQATMFFAPIILLMWLVNACLQAHGLFAQLNRNLCLQPALTLAGLAALAMADRVTPLTAAMATVLAPLPVFAANIAWVWRHQRPTVVEPGQNAARLLRYGLRSAGIQLLGALSQQFDRIFVLGALSPAAMGLYMVARNAAQPTRVFSSALNTVLFPKASALSTSQALELTALSARVGVAAAVIIALPLCLLGPLLIGLLYGREFADSVLPFQLLVIEGALTAITSTLAQSFMTVGRPGMVTLFQLTSFIVGVVLLLLLVPAHGILGAATALLIGAITRLVVTSISFPIILRVAAPRLWLTGSDLALLLRTRRPAAS